VGGGEVIRGGGGKAGKSGPSGAFSLQKNTREEGRSRNLRRGVCSSDEKNRANDIAGPAIAGPREGSFKPMRKRVITWVCFLELSKREGGVRWTPGHVVTQENSRRGARRHLQKEGAGRRNDPLLNPYRKKGRDKKSA